MRKKAAKDRNISPVQTTLVPVKVRAQLTRLARQERVTVSEISRKAITEFVERNAGAEGCAPPDDLEVVQWEKLIEKNRAQKD